MTDLPYTDADLRAEAASCLSALGALPTAADIRRSLPDTYIDSHRTPASGREATWAAVVGEDGLGVLADEIHALIDGAADVSEWAVNLGADGLQPDGHTLQLGVDPGDGDRPRVRMHFAFHPDMDDARRDQFVMRLSKAVLNNL